MIAALRGKGLRLEKNLVNTERMRILTEMPHISSADIQQVASVHAEELEQDSSVLTASAKASKTIAGILDETRRMRYRPGRQDVP